MGDDFALILVEHKPDHAIELLKDQALKPETAFVLAKVVCETNPQLAWKAYQLISDRLDLTCGDHIAIRLLAVSAAEDQKQRLAIISFWQNLEGSDLLREKFFDFWLEHKKEDEELVQQTKQDLEEALKK